MRLSRSLFCSGVLIALAMTPQLAGACVLTYTDSSVDTGQSKVNAWAFVEDYFDEGDCFYGAYYQWYYWEHTYEASVSISSPTNNTVYTLDDLPNVPYGGGSAYPFVSISYVGDPGDYDIDWWIWIFCTIGDWFIDEWLTGQVNAGGAGPTCTGEPATMANEYQSGVVYTPGPTPALQCSDFRYFPPSLRVLPSFTWGQLNGGFTDGNPHTGWGHIKLSAALKLQLTRIYHGMGINLRSGYRCPHGNQAVTGELNSSHMQGLAFDMYTLGYSEQNQWSQMQHDNLRTAALNSGGTFASNWNDYPDDRHLHVTY